jgi:hypothetical protein
MTGEWFLRKSANKFFRTDGCFLNITIARKVDMAYNVLLMGAVCCYNFKYTPVLPVVKIFDATNNLFVK